jgi:tetratricopeptide (TPR) repeat protein
MMLRGGTKIIAARLRGWLTIVAAAFVFGVPASAQAPPPSADAMMSAYREYRAAIERDDWAAAESAGERAWRAAEASGAAPGRIGALALNLAITRAHLERHADAVEPARRALALAEAGTREVDPVLARLVLGEALIASNFEEGERLITSALAEAQGEAYDASAHPAARALGREATRRKKYEIAKTAWESAFRHAAGGRYGLTLSRGEALVGRGIALMALRDDEEAYGLFVQAGALVAPLAPERDDDVVTVAEVFYAHALAWSTAASARMMSEHRRAAPARPRIDGPAALPGRPPLCPVRANIRPLPEYPREARENYRIGAVIVRLSVSADGEVRSHRVLAAVPSEGFVEAVKHPRHTWTVTRDPDAPAGCRMETTGRLIPVRFVFP